EAIMARFLEVAEKRIATVVDRFLSLVSRDRLIGPLFNRSNQDWDERAIKRRSCASSAMPTTSRRKANTIAADLKDAIEPEFDRWLGVWDEPASKIFAPGLAAQLLAKTGRIAESIKPAFIFKPGTPIRRERTLLAS